MTDKQPDSLSSKNGACTIIHHEDIALQQQVIKYIQANYKQIGDISMAYGLIQLIRHGSQVYQPNRLTAKMA